MKSTSPTGGRLVYNHDISVNGDQYGMKCFDAAARGVRGERVTFNYRIDGTGNKFIIPSTFK
ncbi:hypothetical protein [Flexibacterium corallicola]|uniref:hypothetical protein n=1 Tax=Flexibacterium corallicola TaxID=3037259 RepID=UPI00286F7FED|nr:hypothetical protein [Pseudovibrio sp. M1P-2-3]